MRGTITWLTSEQDLGSLQGAELKYELLERYEREIEFELKDVPLRR
ncbi:MAG: hypothetical protein HY716_06415 [Planctomycetes bacterium]|nr:hypothetical protein [Planctomycetota bacterium]